jgi:probable F420-dependent oxidoreductase
VIRFSVELPVFAPDALMTCALAIEDAGFDACFVTDHPAPTREWLEHGGHATLDPFVALSFAAAATSRIRLHTHCLIPAYRHPLTTAKSVATLDTASRGRVILGVAVGYLEAEFAALGVPFNERARRLEDTVVQMRAAWADSLADTIVLPTTPTPPPIWVGGNSAAAMKRAITYGDGWSPFPASPRMAAAVGTAAITDLESLGHAIDRMHRLAEESGRKEPLDVCFAPFSRVRTTDPDQFIVEARQLADAGVTWVTFSLPAPTVNEFCDTVASFGKDVVNRVRR